MKKLSFQKWSLLGLILLAASAVTAAVAPSNKKTAANEDKNGVLTNSTLDEQQLTCRSLTDGEIEDQVVPTCANTISTVSNPLNSGTTTFGNATKSDATTIIE